jgi:hypothetical protein
MWLCWKRSGGGETDEELLQEVTAKLMENLVKNIHVPEVGSDRTLPSKMSTGSAMETGAEQHTHSGSVIVHGQKNRGRCG